MAFKLAKTTGEKKTGRSRASAKGFSAARGSRFMILLGDDGAILVHAKDKTVLSRQFVPDATPANLKIFRDELARDANSPVYLIIDSMDQAFVQQTLPPVSSLSVGKLIKRRLDRDFGANDIKGALLLGREKTGRKDWNFLMVSLERTPLVAAWIDFIADLPNRFGGILLLSVEAERVVKHFENTLDLPREDTESEWKFFISHNKVGGFRQVILRNNRIIFTRMTQPIGESTAEVIAGNIEQETSNTIEYMRRLGFVPQAGLDVYVITSNAVREVLDLSRLAARIIHVMTPFEASNALGITGATQQGDQYGDVVLAACIGADKKHAMLLSTPQFNTVNSLYQALKAQRLIAILALLGTFGYAGMSGVDFYNSYTHVNETIDQRNKERGNLDTLKNQIQSSNLDVEKISDIIDLYKDIRGQRLSPMPFIAKLEALTRQMTSIKAIEWSLDAAPTKAGDPMAPATPAGTPKMIATLTLEFKDQGKNTELLKIQADKVLAALKDIFPKHIVEYSKSPVVAPKENESVDINFESPKEEKKLPGAPEAKLVEGQITIKGAVITPEVLVPGQPAESAPVAPSGAAPATAVVPPVPGFMPPAVPAVPVPPAAGGQP